MGEVIKKEEPNAIRYVDRSPDTLNKGVTKAEHGTDLESLRLRQNERDSTDSRKN